MFVITAIDGQQHQERPVALVRLRHHVLAAPQPRVAAEGAEPSADHRRRIEPGALEHERDHRRRRRLAVRARDRDREPQPHQLGEHLGPRNHRNAAPLAPRRSPGWCGLTADEYDHHVGVADVARRVPFEHADAAGRFEPRRHLRPPGVRSADHVAEVGQQFGDAAHADAADADEVNPPRPTEHDSPSARRTRERQHPVDDHSRRVRPRQPPRRRRHALAFAGVAGQRERSPPPAAPPSRSRCSTTRAAPCRDQRLARSAAGDRRWPSAAESESPPGPPRSAPPASSRRRGRRRGRPPSSPGPSRTGTARPAPRVPPPVAVADHLQIALPGLMRDVHSRRRRCQPRRRLHHGHVDRVRALRAAKDQDPRPPVRRRRDVAARSKNSGRTGFPDTNALPPNVARLSS